MLWLLLSTAAEASYFDQLIKQQTKCTNMSCLFVVTDSGEASSSPNNTEQQSQNQRFFNGGIIWHIFLSFSLEPWILNTHSRQGFLRG